MANLFDRDNYPLQEPEFLVAGDRWAWKRTDLVSDYPTDAYALTYEFHEDSGGGGNHRFTVAAVETTDAYIVEVSHSTTDNYNSGDYHWDAYITRSSDSERLIVDKGRTRIDVDLATSTADVRTHAKKALDAIEAVIENRATIDQSSFSLAGRSLSRMSVDELLQFRNYYRAEYNRELQKAKMRNKKPTGNMIGVRF